MSIRISQRSLKIGGDKDKTIGRLSPDLVSFAESYDFRTDPEEKRLVLTGRQDEEGQLKRSFSRGDKSRSGYISMTSIFNELNISPEKVKGRMYLVEVKGKNLEVQF